ncbi:Detected protein of confused Function [Hibiscus syriacus]|uniref:Detected protein of confused Function n=1 Tax=Hibiscus syriacus TaxID=106335 RepID=A0A6A2ZYD5_HIBSY|nr:cysteine-rich repeat secretory protein 38-like [Hibiscus syriacus]KAE8696397.1 Detected protein of confused Function [Hibiscus syriacus]
MSSSRFVFFVYHLALAFLLQKAFGSQNCSNSIFAANSPYAVNLKDLLNALSVRTPRTGFGRASVGQPPARVHGLALCRGDMSSQDCKSCVEEAAVEIQKRCPNKRGAIIWYYDCLVKYENRDFFGEIDTQNKFYIPNPNNANNPAAFNRQTKRLLSRLTNQASRNSTLYAYGELQEQGLQRVYGIAQCTRDLSPSDCKTCLEDLIGEYLPLCCNGREGGRLYSGSCLAQYEVIVPY